MMPISNSEVLEPFIEPYPEPVHNICGVNVNIHQVGSKKKMAINTLSILVSVSYIRAAGV